MVNLFVLLAFMAMIAFIVSIVFLLIKSKRKTGKYLLLVSVVVFIISVIVVGVNSPSAQDVQKAAEAAGFASTEDYKQAKRNNINTAEEWAAKKAGIEAKQAKENAAKAGEEAFYVIPADQAAMIEAVESARSSYANVANDLAKGAVRRDRAKAICAAVRSPRVSNWVGTITELTTNGDGKGVLSIRISDHAEVKTWNNAFSDIMDETLMDPDSAIFRTLSTLGKGQKIRFSGQFLTTTDTDCYEESSVTMDGSMKNPEFIFRFSSISTYKPSN